MNLKDIVPVVIRVTTAACGLVAVKLTHALLNPEDFATFSLVLFALAIGSAVAAPINRSFWAHNSHQVYVDSVLWTWGILLLSIIAVIGTNWVWSTNASYSLFACIIGSACYAFSKLLERYTYGQLLFDVNFSCALGISLWMAIVELAVVVLSYGAGSTSLTLRLLGPAGMFCIAMVVVPRYRSYLVVLFSNFRMRRPANDSVVWSLLSGQGVSTIVLSVTMTLAVMIDRWVVSCCPIGNRQFWSDFLLVLSYTIALQSLMNGSIDLARKHVFHDGQWIDGARRFTKKAFLSFALIGLLSIIAFPLLRLADIVPATIGLWIWVSLVVRSLALLIVSFTTIDFVQSGQVHKAFPPLVVMVFIVAIYLWMLRLPDRQGLAALALITGATVLCSLVSHRFFKRIPVEVLSHARP